MMKIIPLDKFVLILLRNFSSFIDSYFSNFPYLWKMYNLSESVLYLNFIFSIERVHFV